MRGGAEPEGKGCCGHPRRLGNLYEARCCGEWRPGLAPKHRVTGGANIKCEPTPVPKVTDVLCLDCYDSKGAKHGRNDRSLHDGWHIASFRSTNSIPLNRINDSQLLNVCPCSFVYVVELVRGGARADWFGSMTNHIS